VGAYWIKGWKIVVWKQHICWNPVPTFVSSNGLYRDPIDLLFPRLPKLLYAVLFARHSTIYNKKADNAMQDYQSKVITLRSPQVINNHCFLLALLNEQGGMTTKEKQKLLGYL
jgi:hypothetical protein